MLAARLLAPQCCAPAEQAALADTPATCRLKRPDHLVPISLEGAIPSYLMVGGLVINVVSAPFLYTEYGSIGGSPTGLQDQLWFGVKNATDEQAGVASVPCPHRSAASASGDAAGPTGCDPCVLSRCWC